MRFFRKSEARAEAPPHATRLHVGCGAQSLPGWINIDNQGLPGVDQVLDVRQGLPFRDATAVYAEHFLEHLTLDEGLAFLKECRRVLLPDGILRVSTPNLDWVLATHYRGRAVSADDGRLDCLRLNRAFHGWGHQFLYNQPMLVSALRDSGFARVAFHRYGQSDTAELSGLERHPPDDDIADLPHVLIAEASGKARPERIPEELLRLYREAAETH